MPAIVTLTLNPALDLWTSTEHVVDAHKLRCTPPHVHPGGGGINVARVLHRLGSDALAWFPAGGPTGERLRRLLDAEQVPCVVQPIAGDTRESFSVLETSSGRELRFVLPGPRLQPAEWQSAIDWLASLAPAPRWVVASGSLPPGAPVELYAHLAQVAAARGARMVLDSSGPALAAALAQGVWLVKPSLRELSELSGRSLDDEAGWLDAAGRLVDDGRAQWVALSLGGRGAALVSPREILHADALPVTPASTIGAGDSFLAALVWALDADPDPEHALRQAMAAGAAALLNPGTALCSPEDVARLAGAVQVRRMPRGQALESAPCPTPNSRN